MSEACSPAVPCAWGEEQTPPLERALLLPVRPYIDPLYILPTAQTEPGSPGVGPARMSIYMIPAKARLHTELSNLTDVWVYRQGDEVLTGPPLEPQVPIGPTIEVQRGQLVHIEWVDALTEPDGALAPHPVVAVHDLPAYVGTIWHWEPWHLSTAGTVFARSGRASGSAE